MGKGEKAYWDNFGETEKEKTGGTEEIPLNEIIKRGKKEFEEGLKKDSRNYKGLGNETEEERIIREHGINPSEIKRKEKKGRHDGHGYVPHVDGKRVRKGAGNIIDRGDKSREFIEPSFELEQEESGAGTKTEIGFEKRVDEKNENPELAKKINRMAELSEKSWKLKQEEKYEEMNEIVKELISLYYSGVKEKLGDANDVYKIKGVNEESAKRARGAIGRIEEGEAYIKVGYEKLDNRDVEDLLKIDKGRNIDEILKTVNETVDNWGKKKILLRIEEKQESEYRVTFFDRKIGRVELETKDGKKGELGAEYLYIINQDKAGKETKAMSKEEVLKGFKKNKTLLRIKESKESADLKYVLVVYNEGAEYSYVETVDGKDRQRIRSEEVYKLNIDVIDKIEKPGAEAAK